MDRGPAKLFGPIVAVGLGPAMWLGVRLGAVDFAPVRPPVVGEHTAGPEQLVGGSGAGDSPVDADEMHAARRAHRDTLLAAQDVVPGVRAWIEEATAAGIGIAIASSSPDNWVLGHLDRLGLRMHFAHVLCTGNGRRAKPAPDTYVAACAALGVQPHRALAVEDSAHGVTAAKDAGLLCVAVPHSLTESLDLSAADLRLGSLADCSLRDAVARIKPDARTP